jgi:4-methyl-5(b-hydroxyethyl)-thiazole monophosphate biosynthesis
MTTALVPFAPGFEEMEGVIIVDVGRRAGWTVDTVGLAPGLVTASRGVRMQPDKVWSEINPLAYDLLILPGGAGGTEALIADARVLEAIRAFDKAGKWMGAICAAALALQAAGILKPSRAVTCHPGVAQKLTTVLRQPARTVVDGHLVTSQGPGTAFEFTLTLVRHVSGAALADKLSRDMILT